LQEALFGTSLTLVATPSNGYRSENAVIRCSKGHEFRRLATSVIRWRSNICPDCRTLAAYATAQAKAIAKLPDPNELPWMPSGVRLGRGTKPRDLRGQRFGSLVATRVVGKHESGSLLWECLCDCGVVVSRKSSSLCSGKTKTCGCQIGLTKKYRTVTPNKGRRYTIKAPDHVFASRHAWAEAVKLARGDACEVCGWNETACDAHHLVPRERGGLNTVTNSIVLCPNHHRLAHEKGIVPLRNPAPRETTP
jgi:hypothetical protein